MAAKYSIKFCKYCNKKFHPITNQEHCSVSCRFWDKVDIKGPDDCWEWQASKHTRKLQYGLFHIYKKPYKITLVAHRVAWMLTNGIIPDSLVICHKCDNPSCVNPNHLFLGTHHDNTLDAVVKGHIAKGEKHGCSKLTELDVKAIRILLTNREKRKLIAKKFDISIRTIFRIQSDESWTHVK